MQIDMSLKGLRSAADQMIRVEKGLRLQSEELYEATIELSHSGDNSIRIWSGELSKTQEELTDKIDKLNMMRETLEKIIRICEKMDDGIEDRINGQQKDFPVLAMISAEKLLKNPVIVNSFQKMK